MESVRRVAENTRTKLLQAGFEEIYVRGFQAASVSNILKRTSLTRGAFFHHFPDKQTLGYAVLDEVIEEMIRVQWVVPLSTSTDPLSTIAEEFEKGVQYLAAQPVNLGCPLNNLAQEMSALDQGFHERTSRIFELWVETYASALEGGKIAGVVRADVPASATGLFLVAQIEGVLSLAKTTRDASVLRSGSTTLKTFLESLRCE
jgi:AcrR family transcriptional regulator